LATGVSVALLGGDNRTFDWEFHLQFNFISAVLDFESYSRRHLFSVSGGRQPIGSSSSALLTGPGPSTLPEE
jgi:hypothetical protein